MSQFIDFINNNSQISSEISVRNKNHKNISLANFNIKKLTSLIDNLMSELFVKSLNPNLEENATKIKNFLSSEDFLMEKEYHILKYFTSSCRANTSNLWKNI